MPILSTYLCRNCRYLADEKFLVTFEHQEGQGPETILLLAATESVYNLGSHYSLELVPAVPTAKPVLEPHLEPLAVPHLSIPQPQPIAVPQPMQAPLQAPMLQPPLPQPYLVPQPQVQVPQPMLQTPMLVPQLPEPSALANAAYQAARGEYAAHLQMAAEVAAMKARYEASLDKSGKPAKEFTPEDVKTLEEVIEAHKKSKVDA